MTKQDYKTVADVVRQIPMRLRVPVVADFSDRFAEKSDDFDRVKFATACGITPKSELRPTKREPIVRVNTNETHAQEHALDWKAATKRAAQLRVCGFDCSQVDMSTVVVLNITVARRGIRSGVTIDDIPSPKFS